MGLIPKLLQNSGTLQQLVSRVGKGAAHVIDNRLPNSNARPVLITCEVTMNNLHHV